MSSENPVSEQSSDVKTQDGQEPQQPSEQAPKEESEEFPEEELGECGFCLFMKGGGCKETFVGWENCIAEAEENHEDIAEKCFQATAALKKCMEAHADYYEPILRAERNAEEEAVKELEKEKDNENSRNLEKKLDG